LIVEVCELRDFSPNSQVNGIIIAQSGAEQLRSTAYYTIKPKVKGMSFNVDDGMNQETLSQDEVIYKVTMCGE
jgi:hypothetical protein